MKKDRPNQRLLLGAHMSIADGLDQAITRGESISCSTIQIFTKSNRQWQAKPLQQPDIEKFKQAHILSTVGPIIAHATYLINIGSADEKIAAQSRKALIDELERCHALGIEGLVLHPGAHLKTGEEACLKTIAKTINAVFSQYTGSTKLLLENMAGQGSTVCYKFEHIAEILAMVNDKEKIGVCFDTCHAFAAGYDFRTPELYNNMWTQFDNLIGIKNIHAIHLNDSKGDLGSRLDRHASIGEGNLGLKAFELLFNDKRFFDIPKVLETPEGTLEEYAKDMKTIHGLIHTETKELLGIK